MDDFNVREGDRIALGDIIGSGGNTGSTIPGPQGDGSHLDLTVQKPDGSFFTPEEIFNFAQQFIKKKKNNLAILTNFAPEFNTHSKCLNQLQIHVHVNEMFNVKKWRKQFAKKIKTVGPSSK